MVKNQQNDGKSREVISIHIGQAGTQIGSKVWELYCIEHGLQPDGTLLSTLSDNEGVHCPFFTETNKGKYIPRSILVDTEPTVLDAYRKGTYKNLFLPEQLINGKQDASNCFARGKYTVGPKLLGNVLDQVQKLAEGCHNIQGFFVFHSMGGGTGSGLTSLVIQHLAETFKKKPTFLFSVFPGPHMAAAIVDPYNAVMMTKNNSDFADFTMLLENQAIFDFLGRKLRLLKPHLEQLNFVIAQLFSSITASLRFRGQLNFDLNEFCTNLNPFPRLRYGICAHSPFVQNEKTTSVENITTDCFDPASILFPCNPNFGKYMACCMLYRGDVLATEVNFATSAVRSDPSVKFVDWVPTNFKVGLTSRRAMVTPDNGIDPSKRSLTMVANNTAVTSAFDMLGRKFDKLYNKRAFLHWYTDEGMEMDEMIEARCNLALLENDYLEILNN